MRYEELISYMYDDDPIVGDAANWTLTEKQFDYDF